MKIWKKIKHLFLLFLLYFTTLFCLYLNICLAGIKVPIDMTGHNLALLYW